MADPFVSQFDPSRRTVGKIYQDLQAAGSVPILVGDMSNELIKGCLQDLNEALRSDPYHGLPFYIVIHEKKDLQMKSCILRRVIKMPFRPWPEDDTVVFWTDPETHEVLFCWALPHHAEMDNLLLNPVGYSPQLIEDVLAWKAFNLEPFGFRHDGKHWVPNHLHKDRPLQD